MEGIYGLSRPDPLLKGHGDKCSAMFLMQDRLLWILYMVKNLSNVHTAAVRMVPGMGRAHVQLVESAANNLVQ